MLDQLIDKIKSDRANWEKGKDFLREREIPSKTILLNEGEIACQVYFIKKGWIREWFNKDGKDITFQFFFEGQPIASLDSFISNQPSKFTIESIELSTLFSLSKDNFDQFYRFCLEF